MAPAVLGGEIRFTGIAGCCARAASGQPTTPPPSSVMNARRFTSSMGSNPGTRCASLQQAQDAPEDTRRSLDRPESFCGPQASPTARNSGPLTVLKQSVDAVATSREGHRSLGSGTAALASKALIISLTFR